MDENGSRGAGEWNRTTDLRFTKPLLCQLSYAGSGAHSNKPSRGIQPRRRALLKGKVPIGPFGSTSGLTAGTCCLFSSAAPLGICSRR
jgi:hypothetical protein